MKCEKQTFEEQKIPFSCSQLSQQQSKETGLRKVAPLAGPSTAHELQVWAETSGVSLEMCKTSSSSFSVYLHLSYLDYAGVNYQSYFKSLSTFNIV